MGQTAWSEEVLHYFNATSGDTPIYGLVADPQGNLFCTAYYGGTDEVGTIFEVTP
jgi:streptogramin lyase